MLYMQHALLYPLKIKGREKYLNHFTLCSCSDILSIAALTTGRSHEKGAKKGKYLFIQHIFIIIKKYYAEMNNAARIGMEWLLFASSGSIIIVCLHFIFFVCGRCWAFSFQIGEEEHFLANNKLKGNRKAHIFNLALIILIIIVFVFPCILCWFVVKHYTFICKWW